MNLSIPIPTKQEILPSIPEKDYAALSAQRAQELEDQSEDEKLPQGYYFSNNALMYQPEPKGDEEPPAPIFICSELHITACARGDDNQNHGRLLEFKDNDNFHHEWAMPMELLAGDGTRYREELLSMGLIIAPGAKPRQLLTSYLQHSNPRARARCVDRIGWHKTCFVLPDQTIGDSGTERVILQTTSPNSCDYTTEGTLAEWQKHVSALCIGNTRLIFSASVAFASPLVDLLGLENGGFHFRGLSSTGKTTALYVAASVWGGKDYVQRWRATTNGIEGLAACHNDTLLCLDELSQIDPNDAGETAYMLANGTGKARANRHGDSRKKATWRLLFLSTGEISLADHMNEVGKKVRGGQAVRIVDIPAHTNKHGLFEDLHGYANGAEFAQALKQSCHTFYGHAARTFLECLIEGREKAIGVLKKLIDEFMVANVPRDAEGQVNRVAKRFALAGAAGELATLFGITGWNEGHALHAAETCLFDWLKGRGGIGSQEEYAIVSQVKHYLQLHGESRFTPWDAPPDYKTINRAGFRTTNDLGEIEFLVFPEIFKTEIVKGFDPKHAAKICLKYGLLKGGSNGELTRSERLPHMNKNIRCYRFTSKVLGDDEINSDS